MFIQIFMFLFSLMGRFLSGKKDAFFIVLANIWHNYLYEWMIPDYNKPYCDRMTFFFSFLFLFFNKQPTVCIFLADLQLSLSKAEIWNRKVFPGTLKSVHHLTLENRVLSLKPSIRHLVWSLCPQVPRNSIVYSSHRLCPEFQREWSSYAWKCIALYTLTPYFLLFQSTLNTFKDIKINIFFQA